MVYYRKYRPQKISDLDSKEVREKLYAVLSVYSSSDDPRLSSKRTRPSASVPHAFLFTGPKGLGKTSTARILAKAVNCEEKSKSQIKMQKFEDVEPCNQCQQCISITNGTNLDVLEIDAASNRGIDEIRDLREKIRLSPVSARKKVYIIDEVHMLTTEAFNALLKTIEEPPDHAMFILCTTEPHKVPQTISSRCFHISFTKATPDELMHSFERILKSEKVDFDTDALSQIASLSDGSFRDGAKILEEVVLLSGGNKITKDIVESKHQVSSIMHQVNQLLIHLDKKDAKAALELVQKLVEQGVDVKYFIEQLIDVLHSQLLINIGVKDNSELNLEFKIDEVKILVELLAKAHQETKYSVLPQLPLELAIIEYSSSGVQAESRSRSWTSQDDVILGIRRLAETPESSRPAFRQGGQARTTTPSTDNTELFRLIDAVKQHNQSVAGVLRGCTLLRYDKDELVLETKFKFHKEKLEHPKAKEILEKATEEITGEKVKVSVILKEK